MTPAPDEICERLVRSSHAATLARQHRAGFYELPEMVVSGFANELRQAADLIQQQQATIEAELLNDIAVTMSEFVDNWPQPKKVSTALALIAKTLRAALGKDAK